MCCVCVGGGGVHFHDCGVLTCHPVMPKMVQAKLGPCTNVYLNGSVCIQTIFTAMLLAA